MLPGGGLLHSVIFHLFDAQQALIAIQAGQGVLKGIDKVIYYDCSC